VLITNYLTKTTELEKDWAYLWAMVAQSI